MRFSNPPAYTITGALTTGVELSSRAIMFTNSGTASTTSITADVWITQNPGTRDTTEYGDYNSRTYKSVSFTVNLKGHETLILPLALKKVTSLSLGATTTAYVLI
jgi:hypothetical protein